jgi:bacillithiol biosynthesis deacetylase BshB1
MKMDVLAFGAHPDDVELSCAGLLMTEKLNGKQVGIIDLTQGELGTRGDAISRKKEATAALQIMGLDLRENLNLADGFFQNDKETQLKVIQIIRKYRPDIIICNALEDRHPDHGKAAELVSDASFLSGLTKIQTYENDELQESWRAKYVIHYVQDRYIEPDFLIDVSSVFEKKLQAIKAYETQFFNPNMQGPETYISTSDFLENIVNNNKLLGKRIGVNYAEGFQTKKTIGIRNLDALIKNNT